MARIVLQDVTKRFGKDVIAVDTVSMEIPDGEFMVLVGPSGAARRRCFASSPGSRTSPTARS